MDIKTLEKKVIENYLKTLNRHNITNIPTNTYIRKPYIEDYIIDISENFKEIDINKNIELIIDDIDSNDYYMYIYDNIDNLSSNEKKKIQKFLLSKENNNNKTEFIKTLLTFIVNYFQYYMIFTELLYDDKNALYIDIYNYVKNNSNQMNSKIKNSFNFQIFYYYSNKLYEKYNSLMKLFIKNNLLEEDEYNELKIKNIFLKNLFSNWYTIYKKNVDNGVNIINEENSGKKEKKILSKLLCINNIY
jgi:hypothetical protein